MSPRKRGAVHKLGDLDDPMCGARGVTSPDWAAVTCGTCRKWMTATSWGAPGKGATAEAVRRWLFVHGKLALAQRVDASGSKNQHSDLHLEPDIAPSSADLRRIERAFGLSSAGSCRECGCDQAHACPGGCSWIRPGLCSACAPRVDPGASS